MKRYLLFTFLLASLTSLAQSYTYAPFPQDTGAWWHHVYSEGNTHIGETSLLYTDSSGIMVVTAPYSPSVGPHCVTPRKYWQEGKKVYGTIDYCIYDTTAPLWRGDTLLYFDFDITVGDTFPAYNFMAHHYDTLVVLTDDSTGYQGRRKLTFLPYNVQWVEGIGNINSAWSCFSPTWELSISGTTPFYCIYDDSASFPCQNGYFVGEAEPDPLGARVWPNPFDDALSIQLNRPIDGDVIIYNVQGMPICHPKVVSSDSEIRVQGLGELQTGTYLIVLTPSDGSDEVRLKVVK